jgi:hypothetical protein
MQPQQLLVDLRDIDMRLGEFVVVQGSGATITKTANYFRIFGKGKRFPLAVS